MISHSNGKDVLVDANQLLKTAFDRFDAGDTEGALHFADAAIAKCPTLQSGHYLSGLAAWQLGRLDRAALSLAIATQLEPQHTAAHLLLGTVEAARSQPLAAEASLQAAIALDPTSGFAWHQLGLTLMTEKRSSEAVNAFTNALERAPEQMESAQNLAAALMAEGRVAEAERLVAPIAANHGGLLNAHGVALAKLGRIEEAIRCFTSALEMDPHQAPAAVNLAQIMIKSDMPEEAVALTRYALSLSVTVDRLALLVAARLRAADWDGLDEDITALMELAETTGEGIDPFLLLALPNIDTAHQSANVRAWAACQLPRHSLPLQPKTPQPDGRLVIGYLSSDFRRHALANLASELFELHDRTQFHVLAYSIGPDDGSPERARFKASADKFIDLEPLSDRDAALLIQRDQLDILVDLTGLASDARPEILALKPAPVRAGWLGFAGGVGTSVSDVLIADPVVVPPGAEANYDERVIRLPHCYQINDRKRPQGPATSRSDHGLPETAVVLGCFHEQRKLLPEVYACWIRILMAVPESVLWLLEPSAAATTSLKARAATAGVDPRRLHLAPRVQAAAHLERLAHADLMLDTFPYGAHTTASDALWRGVPIVTHAGDTFASRVSASLLTACGLPELIAHDKATYERMVIDLARDSTRRRALRAQLSQQRLQHLPPFDTPQLVKGLEAIYQFLAAERSAV